MACSSANTFAILSFQQLPLLPEQNRTEDNKQNRTELTFAFELGCALFIPSPHLLINPCHDATHERISRACAAVDQAYPFDHDHHFGLGGNVRAGKQRRCNHNDCDGAHPRVADTSVDDMRPSGR